MGNRAIQGFSDGGIYGAAHPEQIDANSAATPQYTERRTVAGKAVFMTAEDATKLDAAMVEPERTWTVAPNGHTWDRLKDALHEWMSP